MVKFLVTGSSGFIGFHLCKSLLNDGNMVFGIDNMNDYYDINLKEKRLDILSKNKNFYFKKLDISNLNKLENLFSYFKPMKVINLAAQAGVRYSLKNPHAYIKSNIKGFMNVLECCRNYKIEGLVYASSSSVYGSNSKTPFSVKDRVDSPISIYASTKRANELMAHSYSHLYNLHSTGLRFFTVYGPWGRPDMAMYIFANSIRLNKKIPVFNNGLMKRDFTYIDDIISGIRSAIEKNYKSEIFNLGNNKSENLLDVVKLIEKSLNINAKIEYFGMQPGDVKKTFADIEQSIKMLNYKPKTGIEEGIPLFIEWFKKYNNI